MVLTTGRLGGDIQESEKKDRHDSETLHCEASKYFNTQGHEYRAIRKNLQCPGYEDYTLDLGRDGYRPEGDSRIVFGST